MTNGPLVNDLLDAWESHLLNDSRVGIDEFIANRCDGLAPDVIDAFRKKALALAAIDQRLAAVGNVEADVAPASFGR